jgi:Ca-activated chloride channel family protein
MSYQSLSSDALPGTGFALTLLARDENPSRKEASMNHAFRSATSRPRRLARRAAACVALCAACGAGPARAAGLLVADGGFGGKLEIEEHVVDVTINNGVSVTTVDQTFRNLEDRQVEALYTFPVPQGASVSNFSMWIEGKEMVGEVVEKERARQIYDSYKQQRRDPGLLEQTDYKTFEMRIFPIAPRAEQRVRITYYQELAFDNDWATFVYPLATTTQGATDSRTQGRLALTLNVHSEVPIASVESPSHGDEFAVARHGAHHVQASLETAGGDLDRDFVVAYKLSRPRTGLDLVASMEPGEDGYFLMTLTAGEELGDGNGDGMDYIFVLDVSGSMNEEGKLSTSRGSLDAFIRSLDPADRFDVITFNVAATSLFDALAAVDGRTTEQAAEFLRGQRARGGTVLEPAIRRAYAYKDPDRPLNVVVLSDGMTEQAERQTLLRLIGERPGNTRVFTIGVGNDVNRPLLEQLAEDADGLSAFVSRGDDFDRQAEAFRRKLLRPAATDLSVEFEGGDLYDVEPRDLPGLYHGAPVRMYGRYRTPGPLRLTIRGDLGGESYEQTVFLDLPGKEADNPEIERMWAWHRVNRLLKEADRSGSRQDVLDEIVRLGEGYSIVTEYTSFLVLENDAEYARWKIDRRNALRVERDRRSQDRVREKLEGLRRAAADVGPPGAARTTARPAPAALPQGVTKPDAAAAQGRGVDLDLGNPAGSGGTGGGAIDPLTLGITAALGGLSWSALRRRRGERS